MAEFVSNHNTNEIAILPFYLFQMSDLPIILVESRSDFFSKENFNYFVFQYNAIIQLSRIKIRQCFQTLKIRKQI